MAAPGLPTTSKSSASHPCRFTWDNSGFSLDACVCVTDPDRAGLERLLRYCARPPGTDDPPVEAGPDGDTLAQPSPASDFNQEVQW
jgi:hypothetical protein